MSLSTAEFWPYFHLVTFLLRGVLHVGYRSEIITFNPLNVELNPICHLLALLGGATIVVVSRLRVKSSEI